MATFEELTFFSRFLTKNGLSPKKSPGKSRKDTFLDKLYSGITDGIFLNDDEAAKALYDTTPDAAKYQKLKSRLAEQLNAMVLMPEFEKVFSSNFGLVYARCLKNAAIVKILISVYARVIAIPLAKHTLKIAKQHEFTSIVLELARELQMHYGSITEAVKEYEKYTALVKTYTEILQAEVFVEDCFYQITRSYLGSRTRKMDELPFAKESAAKVEEMIGKYPSYRINLFGYHLICLTKEIAGDFQGLIGWGERALKYFKEGNFAASDNLRSSFLIKLIGAYLNIQDYEKAELAAEEGKIATQPQSLNWFLIVDYYLVICFHQGEYQKALSLYFEAINNPFFNNLATEKKAYFQLYEAFIQYFGVLGHLDTSMLKRFRIQRFLNNVPSFSRDKRGANVTLLILQILFLLQRREFDAIVSRLDALRAYSQRYLRRNETFRSNCFIRMLNLLNAAHFNVDRVTHRARPYLDQLRMTPSSQSLQGAELEIVPYEHLWELVLESLQLRKGQRKNR